MTKCKTGFCEYSKSMEQQYPRRCINCGDLESHTHLNIHRDCLDKVRIQRAIEIIRKEKTKLCKRQIEKIIVDDCFNSLNNYLGIAEK